MSDTQAAAEARAERLKRLRNLANLSRKDMCEGSGINLNTLIGWEVARHGGLSKVGAKKVITRLAKAGVFTTLEWLLYGIGQGPNVVPNFDELSEQKHKASPDYRLDEEEQKIIEELLVFKKQYQETADLIVEDDGMSPFYEKGDYVAGVKYFRDKAEKAINKPCIVQLETGEIVLRILKTGTEKDTYTLLCSNYQASTNTPIVNIKILSAAIVIWHRKKLG